jgi:hypothetical protein
MVDHVINHFVDFDEPMQYSYQKTLAGCITKKIIAQFEMKRANVQRLFVPFFPVLVLDCISASLIAKAALGVH